MGRDSSGLTPKQKRFVEAYDGNATAAARAAGYKGNDATLGAVGQENLQKPLILSAIQAREAPRLNKLIASREDRQKFWSEVMTAKGRKMPDRLRASELLGKSEADFTEKVEQQVSNAPQVIAYIPVNGSEAPEGEKK